MKIKRNCPQVESRCSLLAKYFCATPLTNSIEQFKLAQVFLIGNRRSLPPPTVKEVYQKRKFILKTRC